MRRFTVLLVLATLAPVAQAQNVDQSLGADPEVDYASLTRLGPWDDRNYQLTREDLAYLAPNEEDLVDAIPAFFRVQMRKAMPDLLRTGPAQYPRSALQIFQQMYGGYLVGSKVYTRARRELDGTYTVLLKDVLDDGRFLPWKFLQGEVRVTMPNGAAESAVKIHPFDTNLVIAGTNGPGFAQRMHYSTDGGASWTQVNLPLGGTCCDPTVDWSSDGFKSYTSTLGNCGGGGCSIWVYRSADGGVTWTDFETDTPGDPRRELTFGGSDKEYLHVDKHVGSPFQDNVYLTWHNSNIMRAAVSVDFGNTWNTVVFSSALDQRGIGSDITTDKNGNVYYFWPAFLSQKIWLRKSSDGGQSYAAPVEVDSTFASFIFPVPSMTTRQVFVYVSADTDLSDGPFANSVYAAWTDSTAPTSGVPANNHARIQVAYSRDGGATWSVSTPHETADANQVDRWHQWLAVGPDGTVHVIFYDTRLDPTRTSVDVFHSFSTDGAVTWTTPSRITTESSPKINDGFEFGDYNGLDAVLSDWIGIWTDNRNETGGSGDSVDVYAGNEAGVCGNGVIDPGELCDGADLGGETCVSQGFDGGVLGCTGTCTFDTTLCLTCEEGRTNGDWTLPIGGQSGFASGKLLNRLGATVYTLRARLTETSPTQGNLVGVLSDGTPPGPDFDVVGTYAITSPPGKGRWSAQIFEVGTNNAVGKIGGSFDADPLGPTPGTYSGEWKICQ